MADGKKKPAKKGRSSSDKQAARSKNSGSASRSGTATSKSKKADSGVPTSYLVSALTLIAAAIGGIIYTLVVGNEPLLGLDLQGGVSVVYQPTEEADEESLEQTVEIIRNRVDGLGVAEPEISRQGDTIVVDLPGVEQQQRALELVGDTAELRFRPVLLDPARMAAIGAPGQTFEPDLDTSAIDPDGDIVDDEDGADEDGDAPTDDAPADEAPADDADESDGEEEQGLQNIRGRQDTSDDEEEPVDEAPADDEPAEEDPVDGEPTEEEPAEEELVPVPADAASPAAVSVTQIEEVCIGATEPTAPEDDNAEDYVVLAGAEGGLYCLGPTLLTGEALESADVSVVFSGWAVNPLFRPGPDGIGAFNEVAAICASPLTGNNQAICPPVGVDSQTGQPRGALAIVLDAEVISAPLINAAAFDRSNITISGSFEEEGARDLALALRFGALPVELEAQQTRTVSATIGDDVLRAGVIAGLIGLGFVAIYLLSYYRLAGLVAIGGLLISGLLLWTIIAWLGANYGLAISLAGIVGLIVSIGVSADSNIVYFENVKDISAKGRRVSTSVERAYESAISTIVKADVVSLIAAALLYFLTVGAVKGFALYLGIATILDLLVSYMFMRPALAWIASRDAVRENPRLIGMPVGGEA